MPSINDLLAKARLPTPKSLSSAVRDQAGTSIKATSNEIRKIPQSIAQAGAAQARSAVSGAINVGVNDIRAATVQALKGDFSGALTTLSQGPADVLGQFGSAFGLSSSGGNPLTQNTAVNTLQGALGRADPMLSFQWYCELPTITPVDGQPTNLDWSYVEEATPSFRTYATRQIYGSGRSHTVASAYSVDTLRLNFYADIANKSLQYLLAWDGAILAPFGIGAASIGGGFGRPSDYWKPIRLYLVDASKSLVLMIEYSECWPTNIDQLQLDSQSSTRLTYNVSFSAGDVFMTAFGVNRNTSGQSLLDALKSTVKDTVRGTARDAAKSAIKSLF